MDSYTKGATGAVGSLDRTQEDLSKYRQRIDANVEQQREYADMIASLQRKVFFYKYNLRKKSRNFIHRIT